MKPIFLIGFMTAGKTREGKRLAKKLQQPFIDLDKKIEEAERKSVAEIFSDNGEKYFREAESKILRSLDLSLNPVIACGGGTPCFHENMKWMLKNGIAVWLKISPDTVVKRISESGKERPLLNNLKGEELIKFIRDKIKEREPFYSLAQIQIDTENISIEKLGQEIITISN